MYLIWNQVTRLSQIVALVLFVGVFFFGFYVGILYDKAEVQGAESINKLFQNAATSTAGHNMPQKPGH